MKKILLLLVTLLMVACLASCESSDNKQTTEEATSTTEESVAQDVALKVDKVSLAEPESFCESMEEYGAELKELSDENAFEFTFSKAEYDVLLKDKREEVISAFEALEESEDSYVDKVEYDENFKKLKIYVDKEKKPESSSSEEINIASNALAYQTYINGEKRTFVEVFYTGEAERFDSFTFPIPFAFE